FITVIKVIFLYYFLNQTRIGQLLLPPYSDYFQRHALLAAEPLFWGILMALLIGGFFYGLIVVTKGKGMGGGDVKLGAFIGLVLGFPLALLSIFLAFILGAFFSIFLIILGKKHLGQSIPFGPFLVLGSLIALFWGNKIVDWYLHLQI
ncbi:MAG: A24 family peptidase, partial [bacterium]|nr:A24 family peptidase [bacterium]